MERLVRFPVKTILTVLGLIVAVWALLHVIVVARSVIVYILIALFLALAINPLVAWLMRRGIRSRGLASGAACLIVLAAIAAIGFAFIPTLVDNVNNFVDAAPGYVARPDQRQGTPRLPRDEVPRGGEAREIRAPRRSEEAVRILRRRDLGDEGRRSASSSAPSRSRFSPSSCSSRDRHGWSASTASWRRSRSHGGARSATDIYRQVGGYVTGNLAISVIAGLLATFVLLLLGVPFAVALGLLVGLLDLIPLVGATFAAVIVVGVGFLHSVLAGIVLIVFFIVYQQVENHILQPLVYNRTVALSPLAILISILIGAELAGVLGALAAIPVAGAIQVVILDFLQARRERADQDSSDVRPAAGAERAWLESAPLRLPRLRARQPQ